MADPIKMSWILSYFADEPSTLERGKLFLNSNKIRHFQYFFGKMSALIDGSFQETDTTAHWAEVVFQVGVGFSNVHCQCTRGVFKCAHIAALMLFGKENVSKTDVPVALQFPRLCLTSYSAEKLFERIATNDHRLTNEQLKEIYSAVFQRLKGTPTPVVHILKCNLEPTITTLPNKPKFPSLLELLAEVKASTTAISEKQVAQEIKTKLSYLTPEDISCINEATADQRQSPYWLQYRTGIITGSNMRYAFKCLDGNKKTIRKDWIEKVTEGKSGYLNEHMQYGIDHEQVALNVFKQMTGNIINIFINK